jgi:hypothetical protein
MDDQVELHCAGHFFNAQGIFVELESIEEAAHVHQSDQGAHQAQCVHANVDVGNLREIGIVWSGHFFEKS